MENTKTAEGVLREHCGKAFEYNHDLNVVPLVDAINVCTTQTETLLTAIEQVRDKIRAGCDESPIVLLDELLTKFKNK